MTRSTILILSISSAILATIVYAWWPNLVVALALEDSPFAWLQSSLLVASASAAGIRALLSFPAGSSQMSRAPLPWAMLSLLLVFAALDERFMLHERIQEFLFFEILRGEPASRRWTQTLMVVYSLAGIGAFLWLRQAMVKPAWRWCRAGIVLGMAAIALDVVIDSVTVQIFEELLETTAETLFLSGLFREAGTLACRRS